ncbi:hypothetical protein AWM78_07365 [Bacillus subtilis subsp. subtilis]|nr:hypothetical protein AWM78_07365 [Bacillus subtilis subsp. subtilis]GLI88059.1 hypothetical protein ANABIO4_14110 [Bacillus subtilis]
MLWNIVSSKSKRPDEAYKEFEKPIIKTLKIFSWYPGIQQFIDASSLFVQGIFFVRIQKR